MTGLRTSVAVHANRRLIGEAIAGYLSGRPEFVVVGHTAEWSDLMALCGLGPPDAVVADLTDATAETIDWLRKLATLLPLTRVLVTHGSLDAADEAALGELGITTIVPYARGVAALLLPLRHLSADRRPANGGGRLTEREREILLLMSCGHSVAEMAALLDISPRTVESHKRRLYTKLDATSQARAVARAAALGVLDRPAREPQPPKVGTIHVAVCGPNGWLVDEVLRGLATYQGELVVERASGPQALAGVRNWRQRRRVTVLVEPAASDWRFAHLIDAPVVLVLGDGKQPAGTADAAAARAAAVLPADRVAREISPVVVLVAAGYVIVDRARRAATARSAGYIQPLWGPPELSSRERDILRAAAAGETVRQTARSLGIAIKTVENVQSRLYRKLGVRNRAAALAVAYGLGLVEVSGEEVRPTPCRGEPGQSPGTRPTPGRGEPGRSHDVG